MNWFRTIRGIIPWLVGLFVVAQLSGVVPSPLAHELPTLNAATQGFSIDDLKQGKVTLINVFASWCAPCAEEQPILMELARNPEIELLGIAYKDQPARTKAYLDRLGNPYKRIGVDPDGRVGIDWGVYGVPETYVVDGSGRIIDKHVGPLTAEAVKQEILPKIRAAGAKS